MRYNIRRQYISYLAFGVLTVCLACTNQSIDVDHNPIKILGHRGSGANYASDFEANSFTSVKNALEKLHGAEVDVQCSKDSTIWLYHDADLPENEIGLVCIPSSTDSELIEMDNHDSNYSFTKLEDIFILMTQMESKPLLSLDVKGYFPNGCFDKASAPHSYFITFAHSLSSLLNKYNLHENVLVETDYQYFLDVIRNTEPSVECYLLGYSDFESKVEVAVNKSYHGVSYRYSSDDLSFKAIKQAQQKGLKIMLWAIYAKEDFEQIYSWNPNLIQIGNIDMASSYIDN
jgi:glycerophosphoryl diester phosphodiesterase